MQLPPLDGKPHRLRNLIVRAKHKLQVRFPRRKKKRVKRLRAFVGTHLEDMLDRYPLTTAAILLIGIGSVVYMLYLLKTVYLGTI